MTVVVEEFRDVGSLPDRFRGLLAQHETRSFFLTGEWFGLLAAHGFDRGCVRTVATASLADGRPVAVLPLAAASGVVAGLANFYSLLYAPLLDGELPASVLSEGVRAIAASLRRHCALVHLRPLAPDDPALPALADGFAAAGYMVDNYVNARLRYAETSGVDADAFEAALPSRMRHTIARNFRPLRESDGFALYTTPEEVAAGMRAFQAVYAASWKEPEPFPAFMPALAAACARRGGLRLGCLFIEGDPAAAQFWIVHGGRATIYKLAHDPRYDDLSIGSALTLRMFREILDVDRPSRIDFGLGDETFKQDWTPLTEDRLGWLAFNPRTRRGLLAAARHRAGRLFGLSGRRNRV